MVTGIKVKDSYIRLTFDNPLEVKAVRAMFKAFGINVDPWDLGIKRTESNKKSVYIPRDYGV